MELVGRTAGGHLDSCLALRFPACRCSEPAAEERHDGLLQSFAPLSRVCGSLHLHTMQTTAASACECLRANERENKTQQLKQSSHARPLPLATLR